MNLSEYPKQAGAGNEARIRKTPFNERRPFYLRQLPRTLSEVFSWIVI
ncbi:MAG: hypothetical protein HYZ21_14180 [Chloroflexi bacterium]|nr:hypothetical protein [Chloroflexota bacterium]